MYIYIYICTQIYAYIYKYMYICTYVYMQILVITVFSFTFKDVEVGRILLEGAPTVRVKGPCAFESGHYFAVDGRDDEWPEEPFQQRTSSLLWPSGPLGSGTSV